MTAGQGYPGSYATSKGGNEGAVGLHTGYVYGCLPQWSSNTQIQIGTGVARSDDDTTDIEVTSPITVDITTTGANGRNVDTAEQANKWYACFVIKNPSSGAVAGFLINEDDIGSYTPPAGYTKKRRVGWFRNNNTSNLRAGMYEGLGPDRRFIYDVERTEMIALSGGSSTAWADINLQGYVPPDQDHVTIIGIYDPFGTSFVDFRPKGSSVNDPVFFSYQSTAAESFSFDLPTDSAQTIQYQVFNGADSLDVYVQAFRDSLWTG